MDEEPELEIFEDFYLSAYWRLASEGSPIPYSKIIEYGERKGLDSPMCQVLAHVVWDLAGAHSRWNESQAKASKGK